jgi:hypothetical protein
MEEVGEGKEAAVTTEAAAETEVAFVDEDLAS